MSGEIGVDGKMIVDGLGEVLARAEIAFGGLDGGVAEQELDLFEVAAGQAAEFGAGAAQVVRGEGGLAETGTVLADDIPDRVLVDAAVEHAAGFVQRPEDRTGGEVGAAEPVVQDLLDPRRNRDRAQAASLPCQIGDGPAGIAELEAIDVE